MCAVNECTKSGRHVPQLVIEIVDKITGQKWVFPVTTSLVLCDDCKRATTKPEDVLDDGGAAVVAGLLKMRTTAVHKSTRVAWTTVDSDDYKRLQSMRSS